jgi:hypothetical protein
MNNNFTEVEQRVKRYWYVDGLGELAGGGMIFLTGLYFAGHGLLPENSLARAILDSSLAILLVGGALATRWFVNLLKMRLTYPRTGYVEYPVSHKDTLLGRLMTGGIAIMVSALLMIVGRRVGSFNWLPGFTGLLFGIIFIVIRGRVSGLGRFYLLGIFCVVLGIGLSFSGLATGFSLGIFYGLTGAVSMLSGGLTLRHYLHTNPLPAEENDER